MKTMNVVQVLDTNERLNCNERAILQLRKRLITMMEEYRKLRRYLQREKSLPTLKTTSLNDSDIPRDVCCNENPSIYINNTVRRNSDGDDGYASTGNGAADVAVVTCNWLSWSRLLRTILFVFGCICLYKNLNMAVDTVTNTVCTVMTPVLSMYKSK